MSNLSPGNKMLKNNQKEHTLSLGNLLPAAVIEHLQLEGILEEHTLCLSKLIQSQQVPSSLEQWVALGLDMGFPDNGVWSAVAHALTSMPRKVDEAMQRHTTTRQRIEDLKNELSQLEALQAQCEQWEAPVRQLQKCAGAMVDMAQQLSVVERQLSVQAMQQFVAHALPSSDNENENPSPTPELTASAWQAILRSAGLSARSSEQLKEQVDDVLDPEGADCSTLSLTERLDVRYLSQMVEFKSVPFVHPFAERYELNRKLDGEDAPPGLYESQHSCVVCDCTTPQRLTNLLVEMKSPLATANWAAHSINGPRMIMMSKQEMQEVTQADKKSMIAMIKAQRSLRNKHLVAAGQE